MNLSFYFSCVLGTLFSCCLVSASTEYKFHKEHPSTYRASLLREPLEELESLFSSDRFEPIPETLGKMVVRKSKKRILPWENLVAVARKKQAPEEREEMEESGALMFFPVDDKHKTVTFSFGRVGHLIPRSKKVPGFGLRIMSSELGGVDPKQGVKRARKRTVRDSNPLTTTATRSKFTSLSSFGIHPVTECTLGITARALGISEKCSTGGDDFSFAADSFVDGDDRTISLKSLEALSGHLFQLYSSGEVRKGMESARDRLQEVDPDIITQMGKYLLGEIKKPGHPFVYVDEGEDWDTEQVSFTFDSESSDDLFNILPRRVQLNAKVKVNFGDSDFDEPREEELLYLLSTAPLKYKENYYYLERGNWYFLAADTVDKQRELVEKTLISGYFDFPKFDPAKDKKNTKIGKQKSENVYNKRVYRELLESGRNLYLLDCINIQVENATSGLRKSQFEIADIILNDTRYRTRICV